MHSRKNTLQLSVGAALVAAILTAGCSKESADQAKKDATAAAEKVKKAAGDAAAKTGEAVQQATTQAQQVVKEGADSVKQSAANAADAVAIDLKNGLARYESKIDWLKGQAAEFANEDLNQMITTVQSKMIDLKGRIETALTGDNDAIASLKADGSRLLGEVREQYDAAVAKLDELMKARAAASPPSTLPDK